MRWLLALLLATPLWAQNFTVTVPTLPTMDRLWLASVATYTGAQIVDIASSYGKYEANPLYGQRFTKKDVSIKAGITGAVMLTEWLVTRKQPRLQRKLAFVNFSLSIGIGYVAYRNMQH